jgi:hypothetical protein
MRGVAVLLACSTILRSRTAHRRTKATRLNKKIIKLNEEIQRPKALDAEMAAPDRQILLTNPDARSMATSGRDNNTWMSLWNGFIIDSSRKWGRVFGYGRI